MKSQVQVLQNATQISMVKKITILAMMTIASIGMVNAQTTPAKTIATKSTIVKSTTTKISSEKNTPAKATIVKTKSVKEVKMGMHKKPSKTVKTTAITVETKKTAPKKL